MKFCVLSSGSKANSVYIENQNEAVLIDNGLSAKECLRRLQLVDIDIKKIKGILLTHEHADHLRGVSVLSRKLQIPVLTNQATSKKVENVFAIEYFETGNVFDFAGFEVHPFGIVHDAADPVAFSLLADDQKFTQLTDLGRVTTLVKEAVRGSQALVLESNYDQKLLQECSYPWQLKQRISSAHGHLSNDDAATFLTDQVNLDVKHVVLGHLSENSNLPQLAMETTGRFNDLARFKTIQCGSIINPTELIQI